MKKTYNGVPFQITQPFNQIATETWNLGMETLFAGRKAIKWGNDPDCKIQIPSNYSEITQFFSQHTGILVDQTLSQNEYVAFTEKVSEHFEVLEGVTDALVGSLEEALKA